MALLSSIQTGQSTKDPLEHSVRSDIAFDPFLAVAIAPQPLRPTVLTLGDTSALASVRSGLTRGPQPDEISDLSPSQQAMLKMMSTPPRGQDPLGMMAEVQNALQPTSTSGPDINRIEDDSGPASAALPFNVAEKHNVSHQASTTDSSPDRARIAHQNEPATAAPNPAATPMFVTANQTVASDGVRISQVTVSLAATSTIPPVTGFAATSPHAAELNGPKPIGTVTNIAVSGIKQTVSLGKVAVEPAEQPSPVDSPEVSDTGKVQAQALRGLAAALRKRGDAVTVILRPESLGKMRIDLKFAEGGVRGVLTCSTLSARGLLSESVDGLARAMESRGIVVERLEVVHDPRVDPSPGSWDAAGSRHEGQSSPHSDAGGTGQHERGGAEFSGRESVDLRFEAGVIVHDPAFCWDGSRMALSTLA